jgi:hypothetical protein
MRIESITRSSLIPELLLQIIAILCINQGPSACKHVILENPPITKDARTHRSKNNLPIFERHAFDPNQSHLPIQNMCTMINQHNLPSSFTARTPSAYSLAAIHRAAVANGSPAGTASLVLNRPLVHVHRSFVRQRTIAILTSRLLDHSDSLHLQHDGHGLFDPPETVQRALLWLRC